MPIDRPSQLGLSAAMRARDASRPHAEHEPPKPEAEKHQADKQAEDEAQTGGSTPEDS
jgi:hypothetical protein